MQIDEDYAVRSAIVTTNIHRAIALANTIQTGTIAILLLIPAALFCYLTDRKFRFVPFVLLASVGFCYAAIRWGYKYGDIEYPDRDFIEAKRKIRVHLHCWLAFIAVQVLVLFIW